jgi:hypothetical protein
MANGTFTELANPDSTVDPDFLSLGALGATFEESGRRGASRGSGGNGRSDRGARVASSL